MVKRFIIALVVIACTWMVLPEGALAATKKKSDKNKTPVPVDSTIYLKSVQPDHIDVVIKDEKRSYRVDAFTAVYLHGELASLSDLKPGMVLDIPPAVSGSYLGRIRCENPVLIDLDKIKVSDLKSKTPVIQSIGADRITVASKGKETTYRINSSTTVYLRGEFASIADLQSGMSISFASVPPGSYIGKIISNDFASPIEPGPKPKPKKKSRTSKI